MKHTDITNIESIVTDVAVIGGGGSGLAASLSAADRGVKVTLLEKQGIGGNSALCMDIFAAESPVQNRLNISLKKDEAFNIAMEYSHWRINPLIARAFINKTGDTIRWLEDKGLTFQCDQYINPQIKAPHRLKGPNGAGAETIKMLRRDCQSHGVQILTQSPAKRILVDKNGYVAGIVASSKGEELQIRTKCVIIATGGYGGNKELLRKYNFSYHENMINRGLPLMGDGLIMAIDIGAATEGLGNYLIHGQIFSEEWSILEVMGRTVNTVWVNNTGKRFTDENVGSRPVENGNVADRQPDKVVYTLFDEKIKREFIKERETAGSPPGGITAKNDLEKELQSESNNGGVKIADTWDEIAAWIGVNAGVLHKTIEQYNSYCDKKHDELFNKDSKHLQALRSPPYYAVRCYASYMSTQGGIKINEQMQVLNRKANPIPGLYAAGDCAGGIQSETYCMILAGSAFSFALNSGRIAGENAAKFVLGEG